MGDPAGGAGGLGRARVAINGELGVGDVGRPSSGRVREEPHALVWKFLDMPRVTRGSFVEGRGTQVGIAGELEVETPGPRSTTLRGPRGAVPGPLPRWGRSRN